MESIEQAILVGCRLPDSHPTEYEYSMQELAALTTTAGGEVATVVTQSRKRIEPSTYIGKGKLQELANLEAEMQADTVIFNDELSPSQHAQISKNLESKIIDRTQLILDIFASRARSKEGQLQVELAQLQYMLPRLSGIGEQLSRLGAGIGTRGPGETKLEIDRRHIRGRISDIKKQLDTVVKHRERYRERRKSNQSFQMALVGYTNAGKSTLFNQLTQAGALEENQLFATLDPLTRKVQTPSGFTGLLTDTVGFIQHLPTSLIAAFRSTLEEVKEADLILHVIDASHPDYRQHETTVNQLLTELGAGNIPKLLIFNKNDLTHDNVLPSFKNACHISAYQQEDINYLKGVIEDKIKEQSSPYEVMVTPEDGRFLSDLYNQTIVQERQWDEAEQSIFIKGFVRQDSPFSQQLRT
ncbi:GTPase HflX [Tuberibacillus sp. Marseille-P3662]|uniref:GTPase HflX n=1 Tax=Tuberibacillus sp. Marseille-P3662 TaxID=1965358 RepID=UPI000A1CA996|nr:GTPase HflX [Tuberibacillus sp. Marseille-P3662]